MPKKTIIITAIIAVVMLILSVESNRGKLHRTELHVTHLQHRVDSLSRELTAHRDSMETFRWWIEHRNGGTLDQVYVNLERIKRDTE